jgi:acetoin utilization deacetylase AcuC-like enzyme
MIPPRPATSDEILLNHEESLLHRIERTAKHEAEQIDPDTYTCAKSYEIAKLAAGGVLELVDRVVNKEITNGFALVRPPGHHAEAARAMGFCLFNNVAIAAAYARLNHGLERILTVDWDVHHGNGTQASFYNSPEILYFSSHRYPFYPGTGSVDEVGAGDGRGYTINVPMLAGMGDAEIVTAFRRVLIPVVEEYQPQIILVSAGFDAHRLDPLGGMTVTTDGFAALARLVKEAAERFAEGRLVLALEGGYSEQGLAESIEAVIEVLLEEPATAEKSSMPTEDTPLGVELAEHVRRKQGIYWKAIN